MSLKEYINSIKICQDYDIPYDWSGLSCNKNITMKDVLDDPDRPWDWNSLSYNENITMNDVLDNPDKPWDWYNLSKRISLIDIEKHCRIWFASKKIQRYWLKAYYDPERTVCRRRLMREFEGLLDS